VLPNEVDEARDPTRADRQYEEAVTVLRERTRDTSRFRLVFAENMEYGFRRNSLGLRPFALAIAAISLALSAALLIRADGVVVSRLATWGAAGGISVVLLIYWWRVVTPGWVRVSAELYADRLLEAVDTLRVTPPSP
jgi:hypothetical protein